VTKSASVRVTVYVKVDPETAFKVFTDEIDAWYQRGPHTLPPGTTTVRFEPGVGGRLLADETEMGRVTVWEPGRRLEFRDTRDTTVEVTFDALGEETRVTLEHRGLEKLLPALAEHAARLGWALIVPWFDEYLKREGSTP
jgi:uncharacterized protein YndB with AHSA1/START domain